MAMWLTGLLLISSAIADDRPPQLPGDRLLACVDENIPPADLRTLATALDAEQDDPPAIMGPVIERLTARCNGDNGGNAIPIYVGFAHAVMAGQRDLIAERAGVAADRRRAFAELLLPFANRLSVDQSGDDFGADEISDAMLADVRAAISGAGYQITITDRPLRKYLELLARERVVRAELNVMMSGKE